MTQILGAFAGILEQRLVSLTVKLKLIIPMLLETVEWITAELVVATVTQVLGQLAVK